MPAQQQQVPEPTRVPRRDTDAGAPEQRTPQDALGNSALGQRTRPAAADANAAAPTVPRGGGEWKIKKGDTLWAIAKTTYGHGRYWRTIMEANPTRVQRGGDLILVGDILVLPTLEVPGPRVDQPAPAPETAPPAPDTTPSVAPPTPGPTTDPTPPAPAPAPVSETPTANAPALEPRGLCTDYGDFTIYPDAWVGPLPTPTDGTEAIREG
jgi:hypothetical protein